MYRRCVKSYNFNTPSFCINKVNAYINPQTLRLGLNIVDADTYAYFRERR